MKASPRRSKGRLLSAHPLVAVERSDYALSPTRPLHLDLRTVRPESLTYYSIHPGLELGIQLSGEEERLFPDLTQPTRAGDVWLAAMWEMHGVRCRAGPVRVAVLVFLPEFLGEMPLAGLPWLDLFAAAPADRPRVTDKKTRAQVLQIGEAIWEEGQRRSPGWEDAMRLYLLQVLLTLRRGWNPPDPLAAPSPDCGGNLRRIMPALAAIHADPTRPAPVAEAAAACRLSPRHFSRLFQQTMGLTFGQFRLRARVLAAAHLLTTAGLSIEAVAEQAGFVDGSHLHRRFVQQFGCTPAEYRRGHQDPSAPLRSRPSP